MFSKDKTTKFAKKNRDTILPFKTALLVNYIVAVVIFALAFIFVIMLVSYDSLDNCWFKTAAFVVPHNKLGLVGAYISDFIFSVFGLSGWWLVIGLFYLGYRKIIRNQIEVGNWYNIFQIVSFILLIIWSSVFEYLSFYFVTTSYLHNGFGGMLGGFIYPLISNYLGQVGTGAVTIVLLILCFAFAFNISLVYIAEKTGLILDSMYLLIMRLLSRDPDALVTVANLDFKREEVVRNSVADVAGFDALFANLDDSNSFKLDIKDEFKKEDTYLKSAVPENGDIFCVADNSYGDVEQPTVGQIDSVNVKNIKSLVSDETIKPDLIKVSDYSVGKVKSLPTTELLNSPKKQTESITQETLEYVSTSIENKLLEFGVEAKILEAQSGPVVTRYELLPSRGVRGEKIVGLGKEIARGLALSNVRIVETIPGKNTMGIEVPNYKRQIIYLKDVFDSVLFKNSISKLTLALGKDIAGQAVVVDLAKMPHLLVAGTTGSGKSVAINTMILSFLFQASPEEVKFIMIDPKMVELSFYQDIPHLLAPVITDSNYAVNALKWTVGEMERRYRIMAKVGCKNIAAFNQKIDEANSSGLIVPNPISMTPDNPDGLDKWSYIVVIVDELADLMMSSGKKVEQYIVRIAQKARAVGIHLILATQRPSVDVITGLIKANVPSRISFQVTSKVDSRTVLDQGGAETLLGQGDMLYLQPGAGQPQRVHGAFVNDDEIHRVVDFLKANGEPDYIAEILTGETDGIELPGLDDSTDNAEKDNMFDEAVKFIYDTKRCSISSLQTRFGIGYNRAARIMAHLENIGMVRRNDRGGFELVKIE